VRIPNATVFGNPILNFTRNPWRLFSVTIGVGNEQDLEKVQILGVRTLGAMRGVLAAPAPFARIQELGEYSMSVHFFGWVDQREADFGKVRSEAIRLLKTAFDEAGVSMPEPISTVRLEPLEPEPRVLSDQLSARVLEKAHRLDVSPDYELDAQIEEDVRSSDEEDLLAR
jgi:small-conductance mechanosensitive channel